MEIEFIPYEEVLNVEEFNKQMDALLEKVENSDFVTQDFIDTLKGMGGGLTDMQNPMAVFMAQLEDVNKSIGTAAVSSMKKFEDTIINGIKNGKLAFKDFANFVIEQLLRIAIQQAIIKPLAGAIFPALPTFNNGGYTGSGIRAGGVDGKGGFPAVLHPNETVIDHSKGQSMATSATVNFNINTVDASGFDELLVSRKGMITAMVNQAMNSRGKVGVV